MYEQIVISWTVTTIYFSMQRKLREVSKRFGYKKEENKTCLKIEVCVCVCVFKVGLILRT